MKKLRSTFIFLILIVFAYALVYFLHPMPFVFNLDCQSVEITDKNDVILYKVDDPKKAAAFISIFKYNIPYLPWQQSSSWKKITPAVKKLPPDIAINLINDLGEVRYSFAVRYSDPQYVEIRKGFFFPWSKTFYPINPKMPDWRSIVGKN